MKRTPVRRGRRMPAGSVVLASQLPPHHGRVVARPHGMDPRAWLRGARKRHRNGAIAQHLVEWIEVLGMTWNGILPTPQGHVYQDPWDLAPGDAGLLLDCTPDDARWAEDLGFQNGRRRAFMVWWHRVTGDPSSEPYVSDGALLRHVLEYPRYGWLWQSRATVLVGTPAAAYVAHAAALMDRRGRLRPELAAVATGVWARGEVRQP